MAAFDEYDFRNRIRAISETLEIISRREDDKISTHVDEVAKTAYRLQRVLNIFHAYGTGVETGLDELP